MQRKLDPSLDARARSVVQDYGESAYSTSVERLVYAPDGKLISDATWYSSYRSSPEILAGRPEAEAQAEAEEARAATTTTTPTAPMGRALQ